MEWKKVVRLQESIVGTLSLAARLAKSSGQPIKNATARAGNK